MNRRNILKTIGSGIAAMGVIPLMGSQKQEVFKSNKLKGNINHSVCKWCFNDMSLEELAKEAKKIGLVGIDLIGTEGWDVLKKNNLISTMCYGDLEGKSTRSLTNGWCDKKFHDELISNYFRHIKLVADAGWTNLICFSGSRRNITDKQGLENCIEGLSKIIPLAEKLGVVLHMELLNSKIDHKDYMCDNSLWGVELCKRLDSKNFKLLYDIYHMQVDEGDVIRTISENHQHIGHYHTAGVPGRNEIDESQELYYPAIMKAIVETGFRGYVAQEFIPKKNDKIKSLARAVQICDV
ncbi:MAG: hydroxypyruvate isomerase [Flavobacteriaceae bacterium]|nr:hydroxypyruvate isomerase [Flavobacteriaceae bacterium]|tara:strand:+ start:9794 stop:10678 length:885 start_codon:yes stop_codon:yes gene_type:complete